MPDVQSYPTADSPPTDPFEGLVAVYYQLKGYITSTNKWFWVRKRGKKLRGYQDIDVLALNKSETLIVSVTANLDDKIRFVSGGNLRQDMLDRLNDYFTRASDYLKATRDYHWLLENKRRIRKVVAFASGNKLADRVQVAINKQGIELLSAKEIIEYLQHAIAEQEERGLRTNNQLVKTIQLILREGESSIKKRAHTAS
jgi:hypothetical protein